MILRFGSQQTIENLEYVVLLGCSVRSLAQSCDRLSLPVWAIDQFADSDCRAVARKVDQLELKNVPSNIFSDYSSLIFLPGGGTENYPQLLNELGGNHLWCGVRGVDLENIRNLNFLKPLAEEAGLRVPRSFAHQTLTEAKSFAPEFLQNEFPRSRWIWKTAEQGGGVGVSPILNQTDLEYLLRIKAEGYLQQYIAGQPLGATIIITAAGKAEWLGAYRLLPASEKLTNVHLSNQGPQSLDQARILAIDVQDGQRQDYPFLFSGAIGPIMLAPQKIEALLQFAERCHRETNIRGWFQIDFILDEEQNIWLLEINPRWSATMELHERYHGRSLVSPHLHAWGAESLQASNIAKEPRPILLKEVFYAPSHFVWTESHLEKALRRNRQSIDATGWPMIADIPTADQEFDRGMPVFTMLQAAESYQQLAIEREKLFKLLRIEA